MANSKRYKAIPDPRCTDVVFEIMHYGTQYCMRFNPDDIEVLVIDDDMWVLTNQGVKYYTIEKPQVYIDNGWIQEIEDGS